MVETVSGDKKSFCQVEQIQIADMKVKSIRYFKLNGIGNMDTDLPNPLKVSALQNSSNNQQDYFYFYDWVW